MAGIAGHRLPVSALVVGLKIVGGFMIEAISIKGTHARTYREAAAALALHFGGDAIATPNGLRFAWRDDASPSAYVDALRRVTELSEVRVDVVGKDGHTKPLGQHGGGYP